MLRAKLTLETKVTVDGSEKNMLIPALLRKLKTACDLLKGS